MDAENLKFFMSTNMMMNLNYYVTTVLQYWRNKMILECNECMENVEVVSRKMEHKLFALTVKQL